MKFLDFQNTFKKYNVIKIQDIKNYFDKINSAQLNGWQKRGLLIKLKRGCYIMPADNYDLEIISNELNYSYLSLEYALSIHQLIPEQATVFTSVSRDRNEKISNPIGNFYYKKISGKLFTGFELKKSVYLEKRFVRLASPEKALFDLVYFRSDMKEKNDFDSLRLELDKNFKVNEIKKYLKLVTALRIRKRIINLIEYLDDKI